MLTVEGVCVAYGPHVALRDVSLHVDSGELVVMLGANGAGKSTLLKTIARLIEPARGARICFAGADLLGQPAHRVVEAGIALVPEGRGIFGELTVRENLWLGAWARRARRAEAERLAQVLELFPRLAERQDQTVSTMSGGEQQMVAIGRALMSEPRLLLLDEPASSLDPRASGWLVDHLLDCGRTVVTSTHNLSMAAELGERAIVLGEGGRLLYDGPLQEALRDRALLEAANLVHRHRHRHDGIEHVHTHSHDWESSR